MSDITISHSPRSGTLVEGTSKGDGWRLPRFRYRSTIDRLAADPCSRPVQPARAAGPSTAKGPRNTAAKRLSAQSRPLLTKTIAEKKATERPL